jgi:hypothetical protein
VAKSTSGKWVSRVGAAGGGKTYQKTRPGNFYGALVVIVVLGIVLTIYSRYEYQNPVKKHTTVVQPVIGSTLYAALSVQACGKNLPYLNPDTTYKGGFIVGPKDVIRLIPASASEAGANATLHQFTAEYAGLVTTSSELAVPKATGVANSATTYKNGQVCGAKTKFAGKKGKVVYAYWSSFGQKTPTLTTNPATIKFVNDLRVTLAFEPTGVTPRAPAKATVDAMVLDATTPTTTSTLATATTTTLPTGTTTSAPTGSTTTTTASTTTTTASTTTTTKG